MSWVDQEFAERYAMSLLRYKKTSVNPFKINARCPICGDSQRDSHKARFHIYQHKTKDTLCVKCFNCDYSAYFNTFLKEQNESLYREYLLEKRKENLFTLPKKEVKKEVPVQKEQEIGINLKYCQRIDQLPENHPIVKYVINRMIPKDRWNLLYFTNDWKKLVNSIKKDTYSNETPEPRLVIPIYKDRMIDAIQGRALLKRENQKYITIKSQHDSTKIYGTERVDSSRPVLITEGPLDSLFLDNAIAMAGGIVSPSEIPYKQRIWVLDNEPRAKETLKRIQSLIKSGETVLLWDKFDNQEKDINEMIKKGSTKSELMDYILNNAVSGLSAELRFSKYAKV